MLMRGPQEPPNRTTGSSGQEPPKNSPGERRRFSGMGAALLMAAAPFILMAILVGVDRLLR
jgi:hypothetical protein